MAIDEQRLRIRRSIEEKLGVEEAAYLIEGRPPGGWQDLVTKEVLHLELVALEGRLMAVIERRMRIQTWVLASALITGLGVFGGVVRL